uniref:Putative secreted protein n=1 Tax=Ixodes ricinus TaxID=34613 RepID=A0A6B0TV71_IXORI
MPCVVTLFLMSARVLQTTQRQPRNANCVFYSAKLSPNTRTRPPPPPPNVALAVWIRGPNVGTQCQLTKKVKEIF